MHTPSYDKVGGLVEEVIIRSFGSSLGWVFRVVQVFLLSLFWNEFGSDLDESVEAVTIYPSPVPLKKITKYP